jgi:hypothetical protein
MLNEPSLIEVCLSDAHIYDTMGILEHDPGELSFTRLGLFLVVA